MYRQDEVDVGLSLCEVISSRGIRGDAMHSVHAKQHCEKTVIITGTVTGMLLKTEITTSHRNFNSFFLKFSLNLISFTFLLYNQAFWLSYK
jgi:hypothetical protein